MYRPPSPRRLHSARIWSSALRTFSLPPSCSRQVRRHPDVEHRLAVDAEVRRIGEVVVDPEGQDVLHQVVGRADALAAAVLPHDAELDHRQVAGLQEPVVDRVAQLCLTGSLRFERYQQ